MEYRGQVKGGVVIFEADKPPEGAAVRVQLVRATPPAPPLTPPASLWEKLRRYSGSVTDLPADMARNHDHYIHGGPRK